MSATCRFCAHHLSTTFVDLGMSPLSQSHIEEAQLNREERFYPLHVFVCDKCFLVQLQEYVSPHAIFSEYAYFSSFSDTWLKHVEAYTDQMVKRFGLGPKTQVVELASNDGYLLQFFVQKGIPVLGIEPAANVAAAAVRRGIPTEVMFFGVQAANKLRGEGMSAKLVLGNNVLAHVPDINDFVAGMKLLLEKDGVITMEFPHLVRLIQDNQFDTIYHEHFSYLSFTTVEQVFATHGITLFDVEELPTHGGSLRIYGRHAEDHSKPVAARVKELKAAEEAAGVRTHDYYRAFGDRVNATKRKLLRCLIDLKAAGKSIVGYGAPGKGNTLLNYCGIRTDFLDYTVDRNSYKQGKYTPGTRIPILHPDRIRQTKPDYVLILPWNLKEEIMEQMACIRDWGGKFIVPIPDVAVME